MNEIDLLEQAWGIIANAGGGNWERESKEWQEAASAWRDQYHSILSKHLENAPQQTCNN